MNICEHCGSKLSWKKSDPAEWKRRMIANGKASVIKAKMNGTRMGKPRKRNDEQIKELRAKGLTLRQIATHCGISTATAFRGIK